MLVLVIIILFFIILISLQNQVFETWYVNHYKSRKGRFGRVTFESNSGEHIIEIQEIKSKDGWSQVRVLRVYVKSNETETGATILYENKFVEWVETDRISWY